MEFILLSGILIDWASLYTSIGFNYFMAISMLMVISPAIMLSLIPLCKKSLRLMYRPLYIVIMVLTWIAIAWMAIAYDLTTLSLWVMISFSFTKRFTWRWPQVISLVCWLIHAFIQNYLYSKFNSMTFLSYDTRLKLFWDAIILLFLTGGLGSWLIIRFRELESEKC